MIKPIPKLIFLFAVLFFIACEDQITSSCEEDGNQSGPPMAAQLSAIQSTVFNPQCVSCHGPGLAQGGLDLSAGKTYNELINRGLVIPNNSINSPLMARLTSNNPAFVMPPSGKLAAALIDSIAAWIDNGALNN